MVGENLIPASELLSAVEGMDLIHYARQSPGQLDVQFAERGSLFAPLPDVLRTSFEEIASAPGTVVFGGTSLILDKDSGQKGVAFYLIVPPADGTVQSIKDGE